MNKRILFVDDEPLILQGLQRMLRSMRNEWDMTFVESGAQGLELMKESSFDAVVSDMRMPGMNGAELLLEVMKRSPRTIRLILSGHADQEMVLKCVGSTHQYLSKPCDAEMLKRAITRAFDLEKSLQVQSLRQLASQMENLPSIPALYLDIIEKLRDPDTDLDQIADVIGQDLGMTAKIMKLANSAFFGLSRQISSPLDAVRYIGLDTIKSLVLSLHAFSQFEKSLPSDFSIEELWHHSQEVAGAAKQIARMEGADANLQGQAYVAGLLHDLGKLVLAANFPDPYSKALALRRDQGISLLQSEQKLFGANHADVGGYLLGLWGLPPPIVEAIAFHHCAEKSAALPFCALTAVYAANLLVHEKTPDSAPAPEATSVKNPSSGEFSDRLKIWRTELCKTVPST